MHQHVFDALGLRYGLIDGGFEGEDLPAPPATIGSDNQLGATINDAILE